MDKKERIQSVEFWRFAFTILVAIYHFGIFFISPEKLMPSGTAAVEFFFILAGFTLAMSAKRRYETNGQQNLSARDAFSCANRFVIQKIKAIFPIMLIALAFHFIVLSGGKPLTALKALMNSEWELMLMVGTPLGYNNGAAPIVPLWFLTQLLVVGYAYTFFIGRNYYGMRFAAPITAVLGYIFFTLNSQNILDFYVPMWIFNAGTVHAIAEMAMGIALFGLYDYMSKKKFKLYAVILMSLAEVYAIIRYGMLTFHAPLALENFKRILYIMIIILFAFLGKTYLSKLLNKTVSRLLGKISLTMYLVHFTVGSLYFTLLYAVKQWAVDNISKNPMAGTYLMALQDTGGYDMRFRPIPMSVTDAVLYLLLVLIISLALQCLLALIRLAVRRIKQAVMHAQERKSLPLRNDGADSGNDYDRRD
ncbi:MAG: acyltransferase [Oscillospiraceae bacterium]|jgi:peptidoglycan/LPS O-acetylase OafA/YrhL|nr:acyltransferase [Oscillospiraceae bacterium]